MRRTTAVAIPILALLAAGLSGDAGAAARLADCAGIETTQKRLACYDALAGSAKRDGVSGWVLDSAPSRPDPGLIDHVLWTRALNTVAGAGGGPVRPVLQLECSQGRTAVVFDFGHAIGNGLVRIEYRIGQGALLTGEVTVAPDGRRFGVWDSARAAGFIRALYGQPQLRLRIVPADGEPPVAIFDLAGIAEAAGPLENSCAWM